MCALYEKSQLEDQSIAKSDQSPKPLTKAKEYLRAIVEMADLENSDLSPDQISAILTELGEVRDVIQSKISGAELSQSPITNRPIHPIEETLQEILANCLRGDSRHLKSLTARMGWNGNRPITLEAAGILSNVTRERIRQIEDRIVKSIRRTSKEPFLHLADALPSGEPPFLWSDIAREIAAKGMTAKPWDARSMLNLIRLLDLRKDWNIYEHSEDAIVGNIDERKFHKIHTRACAVCRACGVASSNHIHSVLEDEYQVDHELVRNIMMCSNTLVNLKDNFFWIPSLPEDRDRVRNVVKKMLSVSRPLTVEEIRPGLENVFDFRNKASNPKYSRGFELIVPPNDVLIAYFRNHTEFILDDDGLVDHDGGLGSDKTLTRTERTILATFNEYHKNVLDRDSLRDYAAKRQVNMSSFEIAMTYCSIIRSVGYNAWSLVGVTPSQEEIDAIEKNGRSKIRKKRRIADYWLRDNVYRCIYSIPRFTHSLVVGAPSLLARRATKQEFRTDSPQIVRISKGSVIGLGTLLQSVEHREGDLIIVDFDTAQDYCHWHVTPQANLSMYKNTQSQAHID